MKTGKPILCLDFDGVIHSYTSGWKGAHVIPDPPVPGAQKFIVNALEHFDVHIFSSRSHQSGGRGAMEEWCRANIGTYTTTLLHFPVDKPSAMVSIDDRAIQFNGEWPDVENLRIFKPWNKRSGASAMAKRVRALEIAAQCWCEEETKKIEMNVPLAEAFANVLVKYI